MRYRSSAGSEVRDRGGDMVRRREGGGRETRGGQATGWSFRVESQGRVLLYFVFIGRLLLLLLVFFP